MKGGLIKYLRGWLGLQASPEQALEELVVTLGSEVTVRHTAQIALTQKELIMWI